MAAHGEKGTLHVDGTYMQGPMYLRTDGPTWEELAIPLSIRDSLPDETDHTQRNWNQLAREFVADILGRPHPRYLTFRDGWIYQEVIETIRSNTCWIAAALVTSRPETPRSGNVATLLHPRRHAASHRFSSIHCFRSSIISIIHPPSLPHPSPDSSSPDRAPPSWDRSSSRSPVRIR